MLVHCKGTISLFEYTLLKYFCVQRCLPKGPKIQLIVIFQISLIFFSCGLDVEVPTPPSPPTWVQKSLPVEWPERGIDAYANGGIYLEWEDDNGDNVKAYEIYRAVFFDLQDSLEDFELLVHLNLNTLQNWEYVDYEVSAGIQYCYVIRAVDQSGVFSTASDSIHYSLLTAINIANMFPNARNDQLPDDRKLRWSYNYVIEMEDYIITILSDDNELITRQIFTPQNYLGWTEYWQIADEIGLDSGAVYRWRVDVGAKYVEGVELAGSESNWATFLYLGNQ